MASLKRILLALFLAVPVYAGDITVQNFGGGLNTQDSPATIDPTQAQDLLNVNFTPGGTAVYKRDGYGQFLTLPISCSTCAVHGGYHFQQVGGNDVQLWGNDVELAASVNDAAFVKVATGTVGATWQCADSQGFAYCLTSSRDMCVKTDGSSANTTYQSAVPLGTMLTFTPTQLVVAGVSGNESTLYVSAQNAFTNFTIGVLPSSPFTEVIAAPGSRITHIAYYFGKLFWWKDQSFGSMTFTGQNDVQINIISNQIGTLDNSDAFWNSSGFDTGAKFTGTAEANAEKSPGGIFFRGQDNHLYVYDGYYLTRLSRAISPTVSAASRKKANSWTQSTASDFNGGSFSSTSYNSLFGGVVITTTNVNFVDNSFELSPTSWTLVGSWSGRTGSMSGDDCTISPKDGSNWHKWSDSSLVTGHGYTANVINANTSAILASVTVPFAANGGACTWVQRTFPSLNAYTKTLAKIQLVATNGDTNTSQPFALSGGTITFYSASDSFGGTGVAAVDFFQGGATTNVGTGIYYSSVNNAPNLTSWGNFSAATSGTGGSHAFFVRSSTNTFSILSSTPSWVSQTNGAIVAASTGTYMQFSDTFTITLASQTPTLTSFTISWFEGSAADKAYISYFNDAIWFSVASSTSSSTNNRIFYWDILNGAWSLYDIASNGFQIENNSLYFGDPIQGRIFKFGGVTTDNSASINSYWRSKSFLGQDPFVQNEFQQADFVMGQAATTVTYTYTLDSKTSTAYSFITTDSAASLIQRNFMLPVGKIGKYYDFKIGDNDGNASWRLMAHRVHYNPLNWKPVIQ